MSKNEKEQVKIEEIAIKRIKSVFETENHKCWFGLNQSDADALKRTFENVYQNTEANNFPDFLFDNGYIEHFVVTSSKESKKGAQHKIEKSKFDNRSKEIIEKLPQINGKVTNRFDYPEHSYGYFRNSFKKNFEKHIRSLRAYFGSKDHGIFLVEYKDIGALEMFELSLEEVGSVFMGDIKIRQEKLDCYRLSRDKSMLNWLHEYKEELEYIIFSTRENIEIIKIDSIPKILSLLPFDYAIVDTFSPTMFEHFIPLISNMDSDSN
ncbi:hypothetical protein [uncultured Enterococcus sp.]|uniref:hypothetical protein n=1 Tax=uncultured Enterococcus sp. TaxID=167972 RepID=UPI002AA91638|nr:hypothetical protein [uncultured Enterococcus sp.]